MSDFFLATEPDFGADSISLAADNDFGTYSRAGSVMGEMTHDSRSLMLGQSNSMILGTSASMLEGNTGYSRAGSVMGGTLGGEYFHLVQFYKTISFHAARVLRRSDRHFFPYFHYQRW